MCLVTCGDNGDPWTSVSDEIDLKQKLVRTLGFFLEFFPQLILTIGSWDSLPVYLVTCGDHGDHGTSVSYEIDQKKEGLSEH